MSKLKIATLSMGKGSASDVMTALMTGSKAAVVGLWSHESDATIANLITADFREMEL